MADVVAGLAPLLHHHRLEVRPSVRLQVIADPPRLRQIVEHLVENAVKYAPPDVKLGLDYWGRQEASTHMEKKGPSEPGHNSASELLGDWRAAERDTVAAQGAASVAELALAAALAAEDAASETDEAAKLATEAAIRARAAVEHARRAANQAAEAAHMALAAAEGDRVRADQALAKAERAETDARDRFHEAEKKQFPKKGD